MLATILILLTLVSDGTTYEHSSPSSEFVPSGKKLLFSVNLLDVLKLLLNQFPGNIFLIVLG